MYEWTRPYISIPVHGESKHLMAHAQLAQASQVPITKIIENGQCIKLAPKDPVSHGYINTGKLIVEGDNIYDSESNFIKDRRRFSFEGIVLVTLIINKDLTLNKQLKITANGLSDFDSQNIVNLFKEEFLNYYLNINSDKKFSDEIVSQLIKRTIRQILKTLSVKKPEVKSHIIRL